MSRMWSHRLIGALVLGCVYTDALKAFPEVAAIPEKATLEWNGRLLHPESVSAQFCPKYRLAGRLFTVSNATIIATTATASTAIWTATCTNGGYLQWIGADDQTAYLRVFQDHDGYFCPEPAARVLRLDLSSGKFLPACCVAEAKSPETVLEAIYQSNRLAVLSVNMAVNQRSEFDFSRYRVTCFDTARGIQTWSRLFVADEYKVFYDQFLLGGFILPSVQSNVTRTYVHLLSWLGDDVLVCAGPRQALLRLRRETGETAWSIERLWELERGQVVNGPSYNYVSRFGNETRVNFSTKDRGREDDLSVDPARSQLMDKSWNCEIVGGPIIVQHQSMDETSDDARIFIAVANTPVQTAVALHLSRNLFSDCIIYEFDRSGHPLSMVTVPRMLDGSQAHVETNAVIWNCTDNAAALKLVVTNTRLRNPDTLTRIAWYRQFEAVNEPDAWLVSGRYVDQFIKPSIEPIAFAGFRYFQVRSGGYVIKPDHKLINLPVSVVDYADGTTSEMLLRVPLTVVVPKNQTHLSFWNGRWQRYGHQLLQITGLEMDGNKLVITIGKQDWHAALAFELSEGKSAGKPKR